MEQKQNEMKNENMSKSRKIVEKAMRILDYISWMIIAIFVYIWWTTRGHTTTITPEMCRQILNQQINNLSIIGGITP